MTQRYYVEIRLMLWAMAGIACLDSGPAVGADACQPYWTAAYKRAQGCAPSGEGPDNSSTSHDYRAAQRAQQAAAEAAAGAERQRQSEAERIERERQGEIQRQRDAKFIRDRDAAANSLKGSSGSALSQLKGLSDTDGSGLKGSGVDTDGSGLKGIRASDQVGQKKSSKPAPHTDASVVDARVTRDGAYLTDLVPELKNSLAADRITKGFQAVIKHDWPVALAWFQDALNRDPGNAALKRSVDLAQWMVDRRKAKAAGPATPLGAAIYSASHGDSAKAIRQFQLVKAENPGVAPQVDDMINALRQRQVKNTKAVYWDEEIARGQRQLVNAMFETGMNMLTVGNEKGAQDAFNDADFFSTGLRVGRKTPSNSKLEKSK